MLRLTDLREILRYVPRFRDHLFVIALDGAITVEANFRNLLLDVSLLRNLRIGVILVHGSGHQIQQLAQEANVTPSNLDGSGVTDEATFQLALRASHQVTYTILEGLSTCDLRGAACNALVAHPAGVIRGAHQQLTGRIERVDVGMLRALLENDIIPVIPPLGCDGEGQSYRLNSDAVAVEIALAMQAVKLIYIGTKPGVLRDGNLLRQLSLEDAENLLQNHPEDIALESVSKLRQAVRAARGGVPRAHVIDGRVEEGLLAEVFSNEGIGTLLHSNEYRFIRQANRNDVRVIYGLIQESVANEEIVARTREEIENQIDDFYVFEIDGAVVACIALHFYESENQAELACAHVNPRFENQGIGRKMIQFIEDRARSLQAKDLFCLSTQAYNYFVNKAGFVVKDKNSLPPSRQDRYEQSGRRSVVLVKTLEQE